MPYSWILPVVLFGAVAVAAAVPNAAVQRLRVVSDPSLGSAQGAAYRDGYLYVYGDVSTGEPRIGGVVREYDLSLRATGRTLRLTRHGSPIATHPSGLSFHPRWGTLLSDTWNRHGRIFRIDWQTAWRDGTLDRAIMQTVIDDAAINGSRAVFVTLGGKDRIASADYGDQTPALRLYDPVSLFHAGRTSAPGVLVRKIAVGAFNQNLFWEAATGRIDLVENTTAGRGWQIDTLDLDRAAHAGNSEAAGVRLRRSVYPDGDELEGWLRLPDGTELFVTSSERDNLTLGRSESDPVR
jgi:hypothetical protein